MDRQYVDGLVSVIMPVYNAQRYIDQSLASIFAQTYNHMEIVMVDDCSNDRSAAVITEHQKNHPEIIYHLQEQNLGAGHARNKALELASGRYVAFLDSDDVWLPDKIERQIALMKEKKTPFCYAAVEMIGENNERIKPKRDIRETCDYRYLLRNTIIATSSVVIDRVMTGDFRMHLRRGGQDYATWLKLLRGGIVAHGINEALVRYRLVGNSLSSNKMKSIRQVWEIQTQDEKIGKASAAFHVCCFAWNALKKYLL